MQVFLMKLARETSRDSTVVMLQSCLMLDAAALSAIVMMDCTGAMSSTKEFLFTVQVLNVLVTKCRYSCSKIGTKGKDSYAAQLEQRSGQSMHVGPPGCQYGLHCDSDKVQEASSGEHTDVGFARYALHACTAHILHACVSK